MLEDTLLRRIDIMRIAACPYVEDRYVECVGRTCMCKPTTQTCIEMC